ncbi:MAG: GAF domain-containing protein [Pseudomonadota bacterium]
MDKKERYRQVQSEILSVLEGEKNRVARMATVACLLAQAFPDNIWTGFYIVDPDNTDELVVGPYQGTLGCLRIAIGKGVCGAAAASGCTQLVANVHDFPGHIACDSRSVSEIVIPIRNNAGNIVAVLDLDHAEEGHFDETDKHALEALVSAVFG